MPGKRSFDENAIVKLGPLPDNDLIDLKSLNVRPDSANNSHYSHTRKERKRPRVILNRSYKLIPYHPRLQVEDRAYNYSPDVVEVVHKQSLSQNTKVSFPPN